MPALVIAAAYIADYRTQRTHLLPVQVVDFYGDELRYLPPLEAQRGSGDGKASARPVFAGSGLDVLSTEALMRSMDAGGSGCAAAGMGQGVLK
jgi:hypothetical protein